MKFFFAQVDAMNQEAQRILNNKNNEPGSNDIKEENFKPIQGHSKNTETYDFTKDEKFFISKWSNRHYANGR